MLSKLYHHGIKGQRWGERRFQNEDGTLTAEGKKRYSESLSNIYGDNDDYDGDYKISKGSSIFRRTDSGRDDNNSFTSDKYAYLYDYDNTTDDNFYKQFGKKVTEYTLVDDAVLAGKRSIGKAFVDKMLTLDNEDDIGAMDMYYSEMKSKLGKDYVEDLFTMPYEPSKHVEALEKAGAGMVARMLGAQRNEYMDAKMIRRGTRDWDTAANDIGRSIADKLLDEGYSGIRDYKDHDGSVKIDTPTVIFDPDRKLDRVKYWIED